MNRALLFFSLVILSAIQAVSQKYVYHDPVGEQGFRLQSQDKDGVSLTYSMREFELADQNIRGEAVKKIILSGYFLPNDEGAPDIPGSGRYIALPRGATPVLHIRNVRRDTLAGVVVGPAPRIPREDEDGPLEYNRNEEIYSSNAFYPAEPIRLSAPTTIRGIDAVILGITPFQYNPVTRELVVLRDIEVDVEFSGGNGIFGDERFRSRWWDPILSDIFLNSSLLPEVDYSARLASYYHHGSRTTGCEYLILCPDRPEFLAWADTLARFRNMQGILTGVVSVTEAGGNDVQTLESYIDNAYDTWDIPPAAVLLLGDEGSGNSSIMAPVWENYCVSDHIYADVNADDEEEIILARMTARNEEELEVMVRKVIGYETNPPTDSAFYDHPITALGWQTERWFQVCSETIGGYFRNVKGKDPVRINARYSGNPDTDPWTTTDPDVILPVFNSSGLGYIPDTPQELGGWTGGNATDINNAINAGSFLLQHRDHGFEEGWGEPDYSIEDINGLTNTDLTFIFSINCLTGKYNWGLECFAEKFHRYTYNGQPAGALGLLAASEVSYSFVNDTYVWGVYDHMFPDFLPQYGTTPDSRGELPAFANAAGKFFLKYSGWPYNWEDKEVTYNLFHHHGDAFTCLYSEVPQDLAVIHDDVLMSGAANFAVTADTGSFIALSSGGELIATAEGTGEAAVIPISPIYPPAELDIVVTKQNYFRYHARVPVIPPDGPYVICDTYRMEDESGNAQADYAENVALIVTMKNIGNDDADSVSLLVTTDDEYVTIADSTAYVGLIPSKDTASAADEISFQVSASVPDRHKIRFTITASDGDSVWISYQSIEAHAPVLEFSGYAVSDPEGNNNGHLDPGETAMIEVMLANRGSSEAYNVDALLETSDPYVTPENSQYTIGDIAPGDTVTSLFTVSAIFLTPPGHVASFAVDFLGEHDMEENAVFDLSVGQFPVLLIDLDQNSTGQPGLVQSVEHWGIGMAYADSIPDDLANFRAVFLCLGTYSNNHILNETEVQPLVDFLDGGGKLYMEGADTWSYDPRTSLHDMFNIDRIHDGTGDLDVVRGIDGTFTEFMTYFYNGENAYIDHIMALPPAMNIMENANPRYNVTVAYEGPGYKTIGSSFEFNGLGDNSSYLTRDLMRKYLEFFDIFPITESPAIPEGPENICGTGEPATFITHPVSHAEYYLWEMDPAEAGTLTGWDTTATVEWSPGFSGPVQVSVCGMNPNGMGPVSGSLDIRVNEIPEGMLEVMANPVCYGDSTGLTISLTGRSPWLVTLSVAGIPVELVLQKPLTDPLYIDPEQDVILKIEHIIDGSGCENSGVDSLMIMVDPLAPAPAIPQGLVDVDLYQTAFTTYSTSTSDTAVVWTLTPAEAGSITTQEGQPYDCMVEWNGAFTGQAVLQVQGIDKCGPGDFSDPLLITVANSFSIAEVEGMKILLYPNPARQEMYLEFETDKIRRMSVKLHDISGRLVRDYGTSEFHKTGRLVLDMQGLASGMYYLDLTGQQGTANFKILKN